MQIKKWPEGLPRFRNLQFDQIKSDSPWFEIYKINQDTFAFLEPHHDEEVFSYLLLGNQKAALVDTGMGVANIQNEVEKITHLPIVVINTHTHFDHTGDKFRFNKICCFNDDFEIKNLNQGYNIQFCKDFMEPDSYRNPPSSFDPAKYNINPSKISKKLKHLDRLKLGDRTLIVHHTPGHSPGSVCVEDTKHKILFTGDTYYYGTIFLHLPGSNYLDFINSVNYLCSILDRIEFLCPGHNEAYASNNVIISLNKAIEKINNGQIQYEINNQSRFYQFDQFNIRLPLN